MWVGFGILKFSRQSKRNHEQALNRLGSNLLSHAVALTHGLTELVFNCTGSTQRVSQGWKNSIFFLIKVPVLRNVSSSLPRANVRRDNLGFPQSCNLP